MSLIKCEKKIACKCLKQNDAERVLMKRPNKNEFVVLSSDGSIHLIREEDCLEGLSESGIGENIFVSGDFSPKGTRFLAGGSNRNVTLYNTLTLKADKIISSSQSTIRSISFSSNGLFSAFSSEENEIKIIDMISIDKVLILKGHLGPVKSISFRPKNSELSTKNIEKESEIESEMIASIGSDRSLKIWKFDSTDLKLLDCSTMDKVFTSSQVNNLEGVLKLCWHKNGKYLVVPGINELRFLNINTLKFEIIIKDNLIGEINLISWCPKASYILTGGSIDKNIAIWDLCTKKKKVPTATLR